MKSMTGFGRSSNSTSGTSSKGKKASGVEVEVSIKSVNGRFLDIRMHCPREYAAFESELRTLLAEFFSRGTVDVYVNRRCSLQAPSVSVNTELAKSWLDSYRQLGKALKLKSEPSLELLAKIPEVFQVDSAGAITEVEKKQLRKLVDLAASACDQERAREGASLRKELGTLCARLEDLAEQALDMKTEANAELERRLRDRLEEHLKKRGLDGRIDDQRVAHEVVIMLDRADISEELTRLKEHLKAYRTLLGTGEPQGKKLDFYAQELLREVNTIGSKSHIARLTSLVVEAKTLVEKIREQVQNVE